MLDWKKQQLKRQLQESRFRLNCMYKDVARDLYDMTFVATKDVWRISTNGSCIYFDAAWFSKLAPKEMDFILLHQLMHIKLGHTDRPAYYLGDRYHLAADIVANGKLYTLGWKYEKIPHIGKIRYETFLPTINGATITSVEAIRYIPFDPSVMEPAKRRQFMIDSEQWWDKKDDRGEEGEIVLSPLDEDPDDLQYTGPTYGGDIYLKKEFFPDVPTDGEDEESDDDSSLAGMEELNSPINNSICMLRQEIRDPKTGNDDGVMERFWRGTNAKTLDWKRMLHSFVQEDVFDYSFTPPDKRMQDSDFFLPDYNVYHEVIRDVLFMVDTSGSVSDDILSIAFEEIRQALEQFQDSLNGTLAFFDRKVHNPMPFSSMEDIKMMHPYGGGGTDYSCIFEYVNSKSSINIPTSIVIITDGEGVFPNESVANNIPVLWLICGDCDAPWGRSVKISVQ